MPHHSKRSQRRVSSAAVGGYGDPLSPSNNLHSVHPTFQSTDARTGIDYLSRATDLSMLSERSNAHSFTASAERASLRRGSDMHWTSDSAPSLSVDSSEHTIDASSKEHDSYHRVPLSPPGALKQLDSIQDVPSSHTNQQTAPLERSPSREIASVLLLAVAATSGREIALSSAVPPPAADATSEAVQVKGPEAVDVRSNYPLKKRKVSNCIRRRGSDDEMTVGDGICYVSPMSQDSGKSAPASATHDEVGTPTNEAAIIRTSRIPVVSKEDGLTKVLSNHEGPAHMEGGGGVSTQRPFAHVTVPHFPPALHSLLTEASSTTRSSSMQSPEYIVDHTVLQWVSHGQAFRIVRWDAFYRQVLPMFFSHLSIEGADGRQWATGSMDAFMWHLAAWGFEEIKDGPDIGSFAHTLFRRGHPQLCYDMRFSPRSDAATSIFKSTFNSTVDSRSILRVPSLNSTTGSTDTRHLDERDDDIPSSSEANRSSQSSVSSVFQGPPSRRHSFVVHKGSPGWTTSPSGGMHSIHQPPVFVNYRPEDMTVTPDGWHLSSTNNPTPQTPWSGQHLATPPQQIGSSVGGSSRSDGMPPYSPIRIRSARGARRLSINGNATHAAHNIAANNEALPPRGFPVSNRGMGRRNVAADLSAKSNVMCNELVMLSKPEPGKSNAAMEMTDNAKNEVVKLSRSVMKRKLPLMSSAKSIESSDAGDSHA